MECHECGGRVREYSNDNGVQFTCMDCGYSKLIRYIDEFPYYEEEVTAGLRI